MLGAIKWGYNWTDVSWRYVKCKNKTHNFSYNIHNFFSTTYWVSICLLLTTIFVQTGFKTKKQLQQLSEGKIEFQQPKNKKNKKKKDTKETKEKTEIPNKIG